MITAGIDIGSMTTKIVILKEGSILAGIVVNTGVVSKDNALEAFNKALESAGINKSDIHKIVSTDYGRDKFPGSERVTEITCHAKGAHYSFPKARTIIDIGGQDSKVISINDSGKVIDFVMNDRCAAGTGKFLQVTAGALNISLQDFSKLSFKSRNPAKISSMCAVFAESEVISLLSEGVNKQDIIAGLNESITSRIAGMVGRVGLISDVVMTGGVAFNEGVVSALKKKLGVEIRISENPQIIGALGAALIAREGLE